MTWIAPGHRNDRQSAFRSSKIAPQTRIYEEGYFAMSKMTSPIATASLAVAILASGSVSGRSGEPVVGHAYTLNNDGDSNGVVVLDRLADGTLAEMTQLPVATGGKGLVVPAGGDLDSQGPLRIHGRHLLAVNPGSDSIAVFEIAPSGALKPVAGSPFPSGGSNPMSLAVRDDIVYVANQAVPFANPRGAPNITGFRLDKAGRLTPIAGSTIELPFGEGPAQVEFNPAGTVLAVTAGFQSDGSVRSFAVQSNGRLKEGSGSPFKAERASGLSGTVGFSFTADGHRIVVTNFRGSAIRVFSVDPKTAALTLQGAPYSNNQRAMCWAVLAPDGKTLYASNYVTNNVSIFTVAADGTLALIGNSAPKRFSSVPDSKELQVSPDGKFIYLLGPIATEIAIFSLASEDRLPRELPEGRSPLRLKTGQWTMGLALN
jgi:6-phosphogluconolactonase (cycloisomerase 2 family)